MPFGLLDALLGGLVGAFLQPTVMGFRDRPKPSIRFEEMDGSCITLELLNEGRSPITFTRAIVHIYYRDDLRKLTQEEGQFIPMGERIIHSGGGNFMSHKSEDTVRIQPFDAEKIRVYTENVFLSNQAHVIEIRDARGQRYFVLDHDQGLDHDASVLRWMKRRIRLTNPSPETALPSD